LFRATQARELDLEAVFNASPNAYVVLDPEFRIVGCNDTYLRLIGRSSREEIVERGLFEAFPADPECIGYRLLRGSLERVLERHEPDHLALIPYNTSRPGEAPQTRYWSATHTPIFDADGRFRYILQHTSDVTDLQRHLGSGANQVIASAEVLERARVAQAEKQAILAESAWFKNLFSQTPGFVAVLMGPRHVFQITNVAFEELVGQHNLVGRTVADTFPEVVDQGFVELLDRVLETGEPYVGRNIAAWLRHGGRMERHFVDFVFQPLTDSDGTVIGIFVQGHDITYQKQAELELARKSEFLRLAQEAGGFGTFDWDLSTNEVNVSETFRRLYGFPPDAQITIADLVDRVHPDDRGRTVMANFERLEDAVHPTEYRIVTPAGEIWIRRQGIVLREDGRPTRVLGAVHRAQAVRAPARDRGAGKRASRQKHPGAGPGRGHPDAPQIIRHASSQSGGERQADRAGWRPFGHGGRAQPAGGHQGAGTKRDGAACRGVRPGPDRRPECRHWNTLQPRPRADAA
jgi:PAS domain S-box-containing protein